MFKQASYHNYNDSTKLKRIGVLKPKQDWAYAVKTGYEDKITPEGKAYNTLQEQLYPEMLLPTSDLYDPKVYVEQREGKTYYRIATKPSVMIKIAGTSDLLFTHSTLYDAQTGLKVSSRTTSTQDNKFTETTYSEYQNINGVKYPVITQDFEVNEAAGTRTPTGTKTVYLYQINNGIDDSIFDSSSSKYDVLAVEPTKMSSETIDNTAPVANVKPRNQIPRYVAPSPATNTEPATVENQESKRVISSAKINTEKPVAKTAQKVDSPNKNPTTPTSSPVVEANLTTVETEVKLKECFGNTLRAEVFEKSTNRKIGLIVFGNLKEGENKYELLLDANKYHQEGKVYGMYTTEQLKFISSIETPNPFYFINGTFLASELRFKHKDSNGQIVSYYINKINLACE